MVIRIPEGWKFKIAIALLFAIGILLLFFPVYFPNRTVREDVRHAFQSLGDALLIAAILAATVDAYVKQRTAREISLDIFKYLIGYGLPLQFQNRIRDLVAHSGLLRTNCKLDYRIRPMSDGSRRAKLFEKVSYELENISQQLHPYQFRTSRLASDSGLEGRIVKLWGSCSADSSLDYCLEGTGIELSPPDESGDQWARGREFVIPSRNKDKGIRYEVGAEYETKMEQQADIHVFMGPTLEVTLTVDCPDDYAVYTFPKADEEHKKPQRIWKYHGLFFTRDFVYLRWEKPPDSKKKGQPKGQPKASNNR